MKHTKYLETVSRKALDGLVDLWASMEDREHGGFGTIDAFGRKDFSDDRSAVMQGRTLYGLSAAYRAAGDLRCAELAKRLYVLIRDKWIDREYGGAWTAMTCDGQILSTEKAVYENAFVLYGLTEYVLAFREEEALAIAREIYYAMEKARCAAGTDSYADCYCRSWEQEVQRSCGRQRSAPGEYGLDNQSHVIEAYTNLYRVWPEESLRLRLSALTQLACGKLYNPEQKNVCSRYGLDWQRLSEEESFGDDLEVAWLISEMAGLTGIPELVELGKETALAMTDAALRKGLDPVHGGLFEGIRCGSLARRKMWWCNCEAINACLNAYTLTKDEAYRDLAAELWTFYEAHLIAPEGYWRGVVQPDGTPLLPDGPRAMPICAYHSMRVCVKTMEANYGGN